MGSWCSVRWRGKIEENHQQEDEVSTIVKSEEKSSVLQRRPLLQEHHGAIQMTIEDKASGRQEEKNSENSSFMAHERTHEVNPQR